MTDPIADMLTRIRNAMAVKKPEVLIPFSNLKMEIARILKEGNWIESYEKQEDKFFNIKIVLKYDEAGKPAITSIKRISSHGRRVYVNKNKLPRVLNNLGIAIISTSQGLRTNKDAKKQGLGGEVLCEIY